MNKLKSISILCLVLILSCNSYENIECGNLRKEKIELGNSVEEMLDTTKGIYRLKSCGLDI